MFVKCNNGLLGLATQLQYSNHAPRRFCTATRLPAAPLPSLCTTFPRHARNTVPAVNRALLAANGYKAIVLLT